MNKKNKNRKSKKSNHKYLKRVLVVSTMSSGKSTLINALIGQDLFPSRNDACTSKIIKYIKNNRLKSVKAISDDMKEVRFNNITKNNLDEINSNSNYDSITLIGPIRSLYKYKKTIEIIDTPGTNNSLDKNHMNITLDFLGSGEFDVILYVLNVTQLGVNDDLFLLKRIKEYLDKNRDKKIVFVLNKMDQIDEEIESIDEIYNNTIKYIKNIGIDEVRLVSISAELAKLVKKDKYEELTTTEKRKFKMYKIMSTESNNKLYYYQNLVENIDKLISNKKTIYEDLLFESGLAVLEKYLSNK